MKISRIVAVAAAFMMLSEASLRGLPQARQARPTTSVTDHWAVLVAGSNGYWNYRHQADVCHALKILLTGGIPRSNIVLMMYDDVASDPSNPFPGQLFNKPSDGPGVDVYAGCVPDYSGADVTAANFLNVLTGNATAMQGIGNSKVLNSTMSSLVFVNFVDHGGEGLVAFPTGPYLYADQLAAALLQMNATRMYNKLVFYMEACESGSMFDGMIPSGLGVYAVTAARPNEDSWGNYCPPQDFVNGTELNTCLGDVFSTNWMENTDSVGYNQSLEMQYNTVRSETTSSHVMQYGNMTFVNLTVGEFQGGNSFIATVTAKNTANKWPVRQAKLRYFEHMYKKTGNFSWFRQYEETSVARLIIAFVVNQIANGAIECTNTSDQQINWDLYRKLVLHIEHQYGRIDESAFGAFHYLAYFAKDTCFAKAIQIVDNVSRDGRSLK